MGGFTVRVLNRFSGEFVTEYEIRDLNYSGADNKLYVLDAGEYLHTLDLNSVCVEITNGLSVQTVKPSKTNSNEENNEYDERGGKPRIGNSWLVYNG